MTGVCLYDMTTELKDETLPCLGSAIGGATVLSMLIGYYIRPPNPPPERLIGKSPEYVTFYADAYREKIQSYQIKSVAAGSIFGCMTLTGGVAIIASNISAER